MGFDSTYKLKHVRKLNISNIILRKFHEKHNSKNSRKKIICEKVCEMPTKIFAFFRETFHSLETLVSMLFMNFKHKLKSKFKQTTFICTSCVFTSYVQTCFDSIYEF